MSPELSSAIRATQDELMRMRMALQKYAENKAEMAFLDVAVTAIEAIRELKQ